MGRLARDTAIRDNGSNGICASDAVSGNGAHGILQAASAVSKTRNNNVVQDDSTDISGTLTFAAGD